MKLVILFSYQEIGNKISGGDAPGETPAPIPMTVATYEADGTMRREMRGESRWPLWIIWGIAQLRAPALVSRGSRSESLYSVRSR